MLQKNKIFGNLKIVKKTTILRKQYIYFILAIDISIRKKEKIKYSVL